MSRRTLLATCVVLCIVLTGCSSDQAASGSTMRRASTRRKVEQQRAVHALISHRSALGPAFLCVRLPSSGPAVSAFVQNASDRRRLEDELRRLGIDGTVTVRSLYQYGKEEEELVHTIRRNEPRQFHNVDVFDELYGGKITGEVVCPIAHIEVGLRGQTPQPVLIWARQVVHTYGTDRVTYRYISHEDPADPICKVNHSGQLIHCHEVE
jgi:hypothetical protein